MEDLAAAPGYSDDGTSRSDDDTSRPNAQYNLTPPRSLASRVINHMRRRMFRAFIAELSPTASDRVLDIGATSDRSYDFSNYFEALYPWKHRITAAGIDNAHFLETQYPGLTFAFANAVDLPFGDAEFDIVHSSAVLEHVGSVERQARMVAECLRVAGRAVFLTTPNRWFPIEFHTQLPLLHWLPDRPRRALFQLLGHGFFADEDNLNLMSRAALARIMSRHPGWRCHFVPTRLCGWSSNLVLVAIRKNPDRHLSEADRTADRAASAPAPATAG